MSCRIYAKTVKAELGYYLTLYSCQPPMGEGELRRNRARERQS